MRRLCIAIMLGLALWGCGKSGPADVAKPEPEPEPEVDYPAVTALYQGVWSTEASEAVALLNGCKRISTQGVGFTLAQCTSSIAIGTQTGPSYSGSLLIRNVYDHVAGTLSGGVDSAGQMTFGIAVDGGAARAFEDLTGCTNATGDSAFVGAVTNDTLRFDARFSALCPRVDDSVPVATEVDVGFEGQRVPIDVASLSVKLSSTTLTLLSGTSLLFSATLEDGSGAEQTNPVLAWSSADTTIAKVTPMGYVTALEAGTSTVTATAAGNSATAAITVTGYLFTSVDVGDYHACAAATGGAACWGPSARGQLGYGGNTTKGTPMPVSGGLAFVAVVPGGEHTCGLLADGSAYCWGRNSSGQLGDGTTVDRNTPTAVSGGFKFTAVTAGSQHTCGISTNGVTYCWGDNSMRQLGDGTRINRSVPTLVSGLAFVALSAGDAHTCGLLGDGSAYCWGANASGQVGDGTTGTQPTPVAVAGGLTFTAISAGAWHSCAIGGDGAAYCWGRNSGRLGDGSGTDHLTPVAVSGSLQFAGISASQTHTCGVATDGNAYCWGENSVGQLGDGTMTSAPTPVKVLGGITFSSVSVGIKHTCGISTAGIVYCWGDSTTGDGTWTPSSVPVRVVGQL